MELHRFFRYAIEKMCKEKKSLNHFDSLIVEWFNKIVTITNMMKTFFFCKFSSLQSLRF